MKKLPFDKDERIKAFTNQILLHESMNSQYQNSSSSVNYSDIELLANERKIYFIVDAPFFEYTYIEDNQVKSKNITTLTMKFNSDFFKTIQREYKNGRLFAFYSLRENNIRGAFIDSSNIITEIRDERIDELLVNSNPSLNCF